MRDKLIRQANRVVLKVGSNIIASRKGGLNLRRIDALAEECHLLREQGRCVLLVSSGAIASGLESLGLAQRPQSISLKQAAAAVGQSRLMWSYEKAFRPFDLKVAQVLLTHSDLSHRQRFLNARNTLMTLLDRGVVPIVNENDTVSVEEIRFGDNDSLAASVAHLVDAHLLVILSDVSGLYARDPKKHPTAKRLPEVPEVTEKVRRLAGKSLSPDGVGGMMTKVAAAKQAADYGVATVIVQGNRPVLKRVFEGADLGTLFLPNPKKLKSRKQWIVYSRRSKGRLYLDEGAIVALTKKGRSLLPSGITKVDGEFQGGDAVSCFDERGCEVARGLTNYSSADVAKLKGMQTANIEKCLGYKFSDEIIHRDNLVLLKRS